MTRLLVPAQHAIVPLLTDIQHRFLSETEHAYNETNIDWAHLKRTKDQDDTQPLPVRFTWESDTKESIFRLSQHPDMTGADTSLIVGDEFIKTNFLVGVTYYWQVNDSEIRSFTTETTYPRFLNVGGLSNVRDNGARISRGGKILRQGLLYRGSEMNIHHTITEEGKHVMLEELKIKTDLDLRAEGIDFGCPLGETVDWVVIPISAYASFITDYQRECKAIFDVLADSSRYPIYYHCWGGADRTGTLAALIASVLDLSEKDILLDYELTSLSIWGDRSRTSELWQGLETALAEYEGNSFPERARSFLHACGVSDMQMDAIRQILLTQR